jgi:cytokinin dehydrogenase
VPDLTGQLLTEDAICERAGHDQGNVVTKPARAVLRPRSAEDISAMIRFCCAYRIPVAAQGTRHTTYGQALVDGLAIDMRSLDSIHAVGHEGADVDAGALWRDVVTAGWEQGLRVRSGPPGYLRLTVGGVLSVGGISTLPREAAIADRVRSLQVVTGTGEPLWCSHTHHRDLFTTALAGLGQCAVITRAILDMTPVPPRARRFTWTYRSGTEDTSFFHDLRLLARNGDVDELVGKIDVPPDGPAQYRLQGTVYYKPGRSERPVLPGPHPARLVDTEDRTYLDHILGTDLAYEALEADGWNDTTKVWADYFLPDRTVDSFVTHTVADLTPRDVSPTSAVLLFPKKRSELPLFRMPAGDENRVYLFDVLSDNAGSPEDSAFAADLLDRNRRWYERAVAAGGVLYPIGSTPLSPSDWEQHYGHQHAWLRDCQKRFDPHGILTPGARIPKP